MSREVPFDEGLKCDNCGKVGAFDYMGDYYCPDCARVEEGIDLLNETEAALLRLIAQYQSGRYVTLGECIANIRAVREILVAKTQGLPGVLCPNCGKDYFVAETIVDGELCCSCARRRED